MQQLAGVERPFLPRVCVKTPQIIMAAAVPRLTRLRGSAVALTVLAVCYVFTQMAAVSSPASHTLRETLVVINEPEVSPSSPLPSDGIVVGAPLVMSEPLKRRKMGTIDATSSRIEALHPVYNETPIAALARARTRQAVPIEWQHRRAASFETYIAMHRAFLREGRGHHSAARHSASTTTTTTTSGALAPVDVKGRGSLPRRFLLVKPCCQLCNRLRVLVSALAFGILTDRAVLIDFDGASAGGAEGAQSDYYGRFDDLFTSPVDLQSRLPKEVDAGVGRSLPWLAMMSDVICMDPLAWKDAVVTIHGSPAFLHSLYLAPALRDRFEGAFGGLDGLFAAIVHALLPPKPDLMMQAAAFVSDLAGSAATGGSSEGGKSAFVVGLHVRNGRDFRTRKLLGDEWRRLAHCARALAGGAHGEGDGGAALEGSAPGSIRFAVATESGESRDAAAAALGSSAAFYGEALRKGKGEGGTTSREGARRALLELLVVSMSNASVLTPMSSFSETAAALSGRPGLYFHFDATRKFHFESATEALRGCFVPWTAEMPGSMNLHATLDRLPCGTEVRQRERSPWTQPTGLRFLARKAALPDALSKRITPY